MQVASQDPFLPFAAHASDQPDPFFTLCSACKLLARTLFHPLQRMQVASKSPFLPFAAHASDQRGPFFTLSRSANCLRGPFFTVSRSANCLRGPFFTVSRSANCLRGPFFTLSRSANCLRGPFSTLSRCANSLRGVFFTLSRSANPEQRGPLPPCTSCKAIAGGFSPHSPTLPTAGNQLFPFVLYPDYSNPSPSVKGKSPENPKKAPFLLFPRHPHCQNPSIPPAWTQGGLATTTMSQGEKQESRPWKGGVLYSSRWAIWFYAGGLERSTSSEDQNDCTISSASFSSSLLISIRKSFSLPATQRETR